jgi:hypothetical protein
MATGDDARQLLLKVRSIDGVPIDQAQPGDIVRPASGHNPAWLLFLRGLSEEDARTIAAEERGRPFCYGRQWAVLVPAIAGGEVGHAH